MTKVCTKCGVDKDESGYGFCNGSMRRKCNACYAYEKKLKYHSDELYRKRILDSAEKYYQKKKPTIKKREPKPKKVLNKEWRLNNREYISDYNKKQRENLSDSYMRKAIKIMSKNAFNTHEIPKELIELKRYCMKLKRELKNINND